MQQRDSSIDSLRGIAIIIMVYANLLPVTDQSYLAATRLLSSIAAPFFVILSGMMLVLSVSKHSFSHCLKRSAMIFGIACLIDIICWQTLPLFSFDILYFIALSMPLAYLAERHCKLTTLLCLIVFCLSSSQYLLAIAGYQPTPLLSDPSHWPSAVALSDKLIRLIFIDGDFPLLNWFSFTLAGLVFGRWYFSDYKDSIKPSIVSLSGLGLIMIGAALWYHFPGLMIAKEGYAELFYPLMPGCFVFMLGVFTVTLSTISFSRGSQSFPRIQYLGQHALFCYTLHLLIIGVIIDKFVGGMVSTGAYILLLLTLYTLMMASVMILANNKQRFSPKTPKIIRLWLGV